MIVSDNDLETALRYLAQDPHPVSLARYELAKAENNAKRLWCLAFLGGSGTVKERECEAECSQDYFEAKNLEAECIREVEAHKANVKSAENIVSVWQSENANIRAAERVR